MITYNTKLNIYESSLIPQNYFSGFSTRELGDGTQRSVILKFLKQNNIALNKLVTLDQTHSSNLAVYNNDYQDTIHDTDGVITLLSQVAVAAKTADCCPIIFVDDKKKLIGVSHQGWKGSADGLPVKMIRKMLDIGTSIRDIKIAIGPTINDCCYEVGEDIVGLFSTASVEMRGGKIYLNIAKHNYIALCKAGISPKNIDHFPFCTKCDENHFYSYRREGKSLSGELFTFIIRP